VILETRALINIERAKVDAVSGEIVIDVDPEKCTEVKAAFEEKGVKVVLLENPIIKDENECIHCGACMLNQAEMGRRIMEAHRRHVPITNYGLAITKVQGVFERCVKVYGI